MAPAFEDAPSLRLLLGAIATQPWLDVVIAAGLTWAAHSSVAIVLLVMSLAPRRVWCRRKLPSLWCSVPISAPRSTRCWKRLKGRMRDASRIPQVATRAAAFWRSAIFRINV